MQKSILQAVISDQKVLKWQPSDIKRQHISIVEDDSVVVISGIRRCGKSTLLQAIRAKNKEQDYYLNFDDERLVHFKVEDFQQLLELFGERYGKQKTFYFDEIQNISGWERFVRRLHDYGNKVYITGSNASMLSKELGTHLTGRYQQVELYPFSFLEYLKLNKIEPNALDHFSTDDKVILKTAFNDYFKLGGFPAFLKSKHSEYLKSLYESVLYRDVMVRNGITNEQELLELMFFVTSNTSKLISYNSLAKVIGVKNATTVKQYLGFLEDAYMLSLVPKYAISVKKQLHNPKKVYGIDLGLMRQLSFQHSEDQGRLLENLVFLALKRQSKTIYYHHDKSECDFVIKEKNSITQAIQVCWTMHDTKTKQREMNGLLDAMAAYQLKEGLILTEAENDRLRVDDKIIRIMPVWLWLLTHK
ncbi:ATP-binding protein [Mesohalobacter halotolerans]|uniref:ATP-binding protein n=1 Tax=Mesohalobacter halotolerans TaxID=1883405 RepID=A0A4U5TRV0_9FLAO|nr:ATP-binding protein [Mesohalobacter halotolerans]TKS56999.1 ATP-binding protein [Mesohalobacter halotolerans]